ncbi:hypothetical protein FQZ97_1057190 [compost metagenome]
MRCITTARPASPSFNKPAQAAHWASAQAPPFSLRRARSSENRGSSTPAKMSDELVRISGQLKTVARTPCSQAAWAMRSRRILA